MKVKELIALLEKQPQNIEIWLFDSKHNDYEIISIEQNLDEKGKISHIYLNIGNG